MKSSSKFWSTQGKGYVYLKGGKGGPYNIEIIDASFLLPFRGWRIVKDDAIGGLCGALSGGLVGALIWGGGASLSEAIDEMP